MIDTLDTGKPAKEKFFKKKISVLTAICAFVSILLFVGINLEDKVDSWDVYRKWGAPSVLEIFNGDYWGLITSNFLHVQIWHIGFNLYWLWIFGKKIEFESNKVFYAMLIVSSALVSSLAQLSFANTTGIGLSGIVYAFFGFIFIKRKTADAYKNALDKKTIRLFIFWLLLCIVFTQTKIWNIGNAAHIGGLLWGMMLAYVSKFDWYKQLAVCLGSIFLLASSIFWNPLSTAWLSHQAAELQKQGKLDEAISVYKEILVRDRDNELANFNLKNIEIHNLQQKAYELHKYGRVDEAIYFYKKILLLDPNDEFAKGNLRQLEMYRGR